MMAPPMEPVTFSKAVLMLPSFFTIRMSEKGQQSARQSIRQRASSSSFRVLISSTVRKIILKCLCRFFKETPTLFTDHAFLEGHIASSSFGTMSRIAPSLWVSNMLNDLNLTDMETGYKAFRSQMLKSLGLQSDRFRFEPEVTAKVARQGFRLYETPISYRGRDYTEGKKSPGAMAVQRSGIFAYNLWISQGRRKSVPHRVIHQAQHAR